MKHRVFVGAWLAVSIGACAWSTLAGSTPAASADIHPIVDAQSGYLLGGSRNGKWVNGTQTARLLKGGEKYTVYRGSARAGQTTGSKPTLGDGSCQETQFVNLKKNFNGVLALNPNLKAIPRSNIPQNTGQKIYRNAVRQVLKEYKIKNPQVKITQIWRVDLDGDKTQEVLISATNYEGVKAGRSSISSSAKAGEYSLVMLRKIVKGKVKTIILDADFYPQSKTFNAPSVHALAGVYDLNGDGKMEVVLDSYYYEGQWMSVYEIKGEKVKAVLSAGCGA